VIDDKAHAEAEIARTTAALVDRAHQLERRVEERVTHAKQRVEYLVHPLAQVRDRPWRTVGIAFGCGFVIGWLS
jgi:ElaB/YqjD/DUF883 family membrane-anchored ribosome-binding protein